MAGNRKVYAAVFVDKATGLYKDFGMYWTWDECEKAVSGVSRVKHEKFKNKNEALVWVAKKLGIDMEEKSTESVGKASRKATVSEERPEIPDTVLPSVPQKVLDLYVDGSYQHSVCKRAGWAWAAVENGRLITQESGVTRMAAMSHNVNGEIEAAIRAIEWAHSKGFRARIFHDYVGIAAWVERTWQANSEIAKSYLRRVGNKATDFSFVKVKGHSGDKWNNHVDVLASGAIAKYVGQKSQQRGK